MAEGVAALKTAVRGLLTEERGGTRLAATLIEVLLDYLVDVAKILDVNEVDPKDLLDIGKEAWSDTFEGLLYQACMLVL